MEEIKELKDKKNNLERLLKWLLILLGVGLIILIVILKIQNPELSLKYFMIVSGSILLLLLLIYFGNKFYKKYNEIREKNLNFNKLPPPITLEQASELIEEQLKHPRYADYVMGWRSHKFFEVGKKIKSLILLVELDKTPYHNGQDLFFVINMHYPKERYSIIIQDKYNPLEISRAVNALAIEPIDDPDTEIIEEKNPLLGTEKITTKTIQKKEDEKEKDKKEDFE